MKKHKIFKEKGITTLIALVITIIILLILAGVTISQLAGENGLLSKTKLAREKYEISVAKEKLEMAITELRIEQEAKGEDLKKEDLPKMNNDEIDVGNVENFPVEVICQKYKFNIDENFVVTYIALADGTRVTYTTEPEGYTNKDEVKILIKVTNPNGIKTIEYPNGDPVDVNGETEKEIDYTVTSNGIYQFKIIDNNNNEVTKDVVIDQIDKLAPLDFTISYEKTENGIRIIAETEDIEADGISTKSGIDYYEFYIDGEKQETNEIEELTEGDYIVHVIAYDKAGNSKKSSELTVSITIPVLDRNLSTGKIEVVFIDKNNNIIDAPLSPILKGNMSPIKLNDLGTDFETTTEDKWGYNYVAGVGNNENKNSIWANAQTTDGSMFVWIPRYAYRITYYDEDNETIIGYCDARGIVDSKGEIIYKNNEGIETVGNYIVHPAFTADAKNGGGFGKLSGIWVGKFETSGTIDALNVKPGIKSIKGKTANEFYKAGKNATFGEVEELKSHMLKNSEFGAVAYFAHSQYGTNGKLVEINDSSSMYTGGSDVISTIYTTNVNQSSTHNAYGIYDLNGGNYEEVASYIYNEDEVYEKLKTSGGEEVGDFYGSNEEERSTSTEYKMVYKSNGSTSKDYELTSGIRGDAIYETSNDNKNNNAWFLARCTIPSKRKSFF